MSDISEAIVVLRLNENHLTLKRNINGDIAWFEERIIFDDNVDYEEYITYWILNEIRPVLYNMPFEKITIDCNAELMEKYKKNLLIVDRIVVSTNNFLKQIRHLKEMAKDFERVLFYNVGGDERGKILYDYIQSCGKAVEYKSFDPGFNPVKRQWEPVGVPEPLEAFIQWLKENSIARVVTINQYLLENYLNNTGIHLTSVFHYLGIQLIIYDEDEYSQGMCGYLRKAFFNCNEFYRISHTCWHEQFDKRLNLSNVHYSVIPQQFSDDTQVETLDSDYDVVVLSHCRLASVKSMIRPILYLLDTFEDRDLFSSLQTWYCSVYYMIHNVMKLDEFKLHHYNRILTSLFYHVTNFLKYELIEQLDTDRKIIIYGDAG